MGSRNGLSGSGAFCYVHRSHCVSRKSQNIATQLHAESCKWFLIALLWCWCILQALTRPSAANKSFPYHVRTTQVGAASAFNHANGNSVERINNTHAYAPSYVDANGRTVDIFTVSGVLQVAQFLAHFQTYVSDCRTISMAGNVIQIFFRVLHNLQQQPWDHPWMFSVSIPKMDHWAQWIRTTII